MVGLLCRYQRWHPNLGFRMFEAKCSRTKVLRKPHCVASVCPQVLHLHRSEWKGNKLIKSLQTFLWSIICFLASLAMGPQSIRHSHISFFTHRFIKDVHGCLLVSRVTQKPFRTSLVAQMVKNPPANAGDSGWTPELGRSPGEGNGYPLQYTCLENPKDRGAWQVQRIGSQRFGHNWVTNI